MNMTQKQKKTLAIVGAILLVLYFGPGVILTLRHFMITREMAARRQTRRPVPPKIERQTRTVAPDPNGAPFPLSAIAGFWQGSTFQATGTCMMHLELRANPQAAGHMMGFPSVVCGNVNAAKSGNPNLAMATFNPTTAIMDGVWDKGRLAIVFTVAKSISPDNCPITAFSVTPFGSKGLNAEWQQETCHSGSVLMERTSR